MSYAATIARSYSVRCSICMSCYDTEDLADAKRERLEHNRSTPHLASARALGKADRQPERYIALDTIGVGGPPAQLPNQADPSH